MAQTYRAHNRPSPIHDNEGKLAFILQQQLKGYKNKDASCKPQKALTPKILQFLHQNTLTVTNRACGELANGTFFFAMHSCEYTKTMDERHTKLLCLQNLRFYHDRKELPHSHPKLHLADCIAITFEFQKNDECNATVMMHWTRDLTLGPVKAWATIVCRILSYEGTGPDTPVNTVHLENGMMIKVTSKMLLNRIHAAISFFGEAELGYSMGDVGTHLIRSGAAMAMYLAGVPVFTIMLIGHWSSDAFLHYIHCQVQEFSAGVSSRMLLSHDFFTIPDVTHHEDPRTRGHSHNFTVHSNFGPDAQCWASAPAFALHY